MPSLTAVRFDSLACTPALCVAAGNRWIKVTGSLGIRPGQGVLLLSRDHGISWHLAPLPRQVTGVEVEAIAATGGDGWVVGGASGLVAWTSNEGRSWTVSHPLRAMQAVMGLSCPGNGRCQAIGTIGTNVVAIASIAVLARTGPVSRNDFRAPCCKRPKVSSVTCASTVECFATIALPQTRAEAMTHAPMTDAVLVTADGGRYWRLEELASP